MRRGLARDKTRPLADSILAAAFTAFFAFIALAMLAKKMDRAPAIVLFAVLWGALLYAVYRLIAAAAERWSKKRLIFAAVIAAVAVFAAQIIFVRAICYIKPNWDYAAIYNEASMFVNGEFPNHPYLNKSPNNTLIFMLEVVIIRLCALLGIKDSYFALVVLSVLAADLSIVILCRCSKKLGGVRCAAACAALSIPLVAFNPWISMFYTDSLSMPVGVGLFACFLRIKEAPCLKKRQAWAAAFGALGAVGYLLKPTNIVMPIAVIVVVLVRLITEKGRRVQREGITTAAAALLCFAVIVGSLAPLRALTLKGAYSPAMAEEETFPVTHYLMMGLNVWDEAESYGEWRAEDVMETQFRITQKDKREYNISVIKERLKGFGVAGYIEFIAMKARGTYMRGDCGFVGGSEECPYETPANTALVRAMRGYYFEGGETNGLYLNESDGRWLLVLVLLCASIFVKEKDGAKRDAVAVLKLFLLGHAVFLMLFETSARYTAMCMPVFTLLAGYTFCALKPLRAEKAPESLPEH